jgi:putative ABC transport system permease protein
MLKNYLKIAWRNLLRNKNYTLINITGLTVGMACCILIALYVREELSYDTFHTKADRIVEVAIDHPDFGKMLSTPYALAEGLEDEVPTVKKATRISGIRDLNVSPDGETYIALERGEYAEPSFFDLFSFSVLKGDARKALAKPDNIVLTQQSSRKIFGDANPLGQSIYWQQHDTTLVLNVAGVMQNTPRNSTLQFDALVSMTTMKKSYRKPDAWGVYSFRTFALLQPEVRDHTVQGQYQALVKSHYKNDDGSEPEEGFFNVPLSRLHLSTLSHDEGFTGNLSYLYLFSSIALFVLIIACVNYINLATAQTSLRSREVGVRKTMGASRKQIMIQFLGESTIFCVVAFFIGLVLAEIALPFFNSLFETTLSIHLPVLPMAGLLAAAILVGLLSGIYPALFLSGFSPIFVLRNRLSSGSGKFLLRKVLVVSQFAIALVLIIGSMIIFNQLQYTQTADLGFDGEQVLMAELPNAAAWRTRNQLRDKMRSFPDVQDASVVSGAPGSFNISMSLKPNDFSDEQQAKNEESAVTFSPAVVDPNFIDLLHIELLAGRNFSENLSSDVQNAYILNKNGVKQMGWTPEQAIGKSFKFPQKGKIVGVVENFHITSLHEALKPVVLMLHESSYFSTNGFLLARLKSGQISNSVQSIEREMQKYAPHYSFDYEFLDQKFDAMYRTDQRLGEVIGAFTIIAILIACLGLYGLAMFSAERRTKEIGIRKVLGATVTNIVGLLSKDFLKLVALGFIIAVPIAWYAMNRWLQDFAYKIEIGPGIFLLAGGLALLIALATISWQSIRAALANPVDSLRSE